MSKTNYRTKAHPHGKLVTNFEKTIAFVRISKCGSSTFTKRHELHYWDKFSNHQDTYLTFCAIRDPFERFLSSIPETICRIYNLNKDESKHCYSDIPIADEIYNYLSIKIRKEGNIVKAFMSTIEEYGYFDAHHEPMIRFLLNEKKQIEINPITISVNEIDMLSKFLFSLSGQNLSKIKLKNYNSNSEKSENLIKNSSIQAPKTFHPIDLFRQTCSYVRSSYYGIQSLSTIKKLDIHPLKEYQDFYPFKYKSWYHMKSLIYQNVKSEAKKFSINPFIVKYYSEDLKLYYSILKSSQKKHLGNFLSSSKRLDKYIN